MISRAAPFLAAILWLLPGLWHQEPSQSHSGAIDAEQDGPEKSGFVPFALSAVEVRYPREARLAHMEGIVRVEVSVKDDGSVRDVRVISGHPVLVGAVVPALRQWRFQSGVSLMETKVPLRFTFSIEGPPKPAFITLADKRVIRADEVYEFADGIVYTVHKHWHLIPAESVTRITRCVLSADPHNTCVPGGGPNYNIRAMPLLPTSYAKETNRTPHR